MNQTKLNEQIAFLRRENHMTQEELAQKLGVSNQSVSKWESAQCCPDLQLLPEIAELFGVSIDELMGVPKQNSFENEYLGLKSWFETCPDEMVFEYAFRLSVLLHEVVCATADREHTYWDADKNYGLESIPKRWGYSAYGGPTGNALYIGSGIFWADYTSYMQPTAGQLHDLQIQLKRVADPKVFTVLYALYHLTLRDFDFYASVDELAAETHLGNAEIEEALEHIPVTVKSENGQTLYRICGSFMHAPALLLMLRER